MVVVVVVVVALAVAQAVVVVKVVGWCWRGACPYLKPGHQGHHGVVQEFRDLTHMHVQRFRQDARHLVAVVAVVHACACTADRGRGGKESNYLHCE